MWEIKSTEGVNKSVNHQNITLSWIITLPPLPWQRNSVGKRSHIASEPHYKPWHFPAAFSCYRQTMVWVQPGIDPPAVLAFPSSLSETY